MNGENSSGENNTGENSTGDNSKGWKAATALAVIMGLVLAGVVYVLMDSRAQDMVDELAAATSTTESSDTTTDSTSSATTSPDTTTGESTEDTVDGDLQERMDEELGNLYEDVLGPEGAALLDELIEGGGENGLGGMAGGLDPNIMQCLDPAGMSFGSEGDIPDGDTATRVQGIADLVAEDRGISSDAELDIEFATQEEVARRVRELTEEELDPGVIDYQTRLYTALGAIPGDRDLGEIQMDALDAAVGGFYDSETGELVIGSEEIDALGALVVAHEVQHAVADDVLGLPDLEAIDENEGGDAALAALALVEGDASLISQQFMMEHMSFQDLLEVTMTSMETTDALGDIPHHVRRSLEFPYLEGLGYVCALTLDGGWEQVDAAYEQPPQTTAEILFPDRETPQNVDPPDPNGPQGWSELGSDTFGAAELMFLLEAPGGDTEAALSDPKQRVESWAGGEVTVWAQGADTAMTLRLADGEGPTDLCGTMTEFYAAAFPQANAAGPDGDRIFEGENGTGRIVCADGTVTMGIAPDEQTARSITNG